MLASVEFFVLVGDGVAPDAQKLSCLFERVRFVRSFNVLGSSLLVLAVGALQCF